MVVCAIATAGSIAITSATGPTKNFAMAISTEGGAFRPLTESSGPYQSGNGRLPCSFPWLTDANVNHPAIVLDAITIEHTAYEVLCEATT
jgi:hypothetical protein